ncbi:hypothetical protein ATE49_12475 [Elizabethkingia miricola]|uniref:hypothetical protein n=1 Tax=Elizabethkingia miricola TaxID=172045 RepID=UPI0007EE6A5F|nr:hypothetical protein [Elizabethkingia miricola]OBS13472.1 hypothetical protein ATE49_12475 [Elizabethkingia miricola]
MSKGFKGFIKWIKDLLTEVKMVLKLIEDASLLPYEAEVLFKSNVTFVVESVNKGVRHLLDKNRRVTEIIIKEK